MSAPIKYTPRTRLLLLADALDAWPAEQFNMLEFGGFALGLAVHMFGSDLGVTWDKYGCPRNADGGDWVYVAQDLFGINASESYELFYPGYRRTGRETPKQMASVIRDFLSR